MHTVLDQIFPGLLAWIHISDFSLFLSLRGVGSYDFEKFPFVRAVVVLDHLLLKKLPILADTLDLNIGTLQTVERVEKLLSHLGTFLGQSLVVPIISDRGGGTFDDDGADALEGVFAKDGKCYPHRVHSPQVPAVSRIDVTLVVTEIEMGMDKGVLEDSFGGIYLIISGIDIGGGSGCQSVEVAANDNSYEKYPPYYFHLTLIYVNKSHKTHKFT